jgi:hypothetical protein
MKYHFIIFGLGLALGLFFSFMYRTLLPDTAPLSKTVKELPKKLEVQVAKTEITYTKTFDSLKRQSIKLGQELKQTKTELDKAKQKNYSLQVQVYSLLDRQNPTDSSCDSLITTVEYLMQSSTEKDSLYENVSSNLEQQLSNKDSTIGAKDKQYQEIKSAFTKSIEGQKELIDQNKILNKQFKRQKFKSKVLTAALLIFTGAATSYLIHH